MFKGSETYRSKALAAERMAQDARDAEIRKQWAELAIEWHAIASVARELADDRRNMISR